MNKFLLILILSVFYLQQTTFAQCTVLLNFTGTANGNSPLGSLVSDSTYLYGMTYQGGANNFGAIFKIKPDGTGFLKLLDFSGTNGKYPNGNLYYDGTFLYGMTEYGGANNVGLIFKIKPDGSGYAKLLDFVGSTNGQYPQGSLISDGTFLYGMTTTGGANINKGTIFKIMPNGTGYVKLLDFAGTTNGWNPYGSLVSDGTFLYGMTKLGGTSTNCGSNGCGIIFKIKPDGSGFLKLMDFSGMTNGNFPTGDLIYDGTFLYGMASGGGTSTNCTGGCGTIFKIKSDGSGYTDILDFDNLTDGSNPYGSLFSDGTFLYGMTSAGGANSSGTAFKIMSDGTGYVKLLDFVGTTTGSTPYGTLISDGTYLYGMTYSGGTNSNGVVFKITTIVDIEQFSSINNQLSAYPNPTSNTISLEHKNNLNYQNSTIIIQNTLGQIIKKVLSSKDISVSGLTEGCYFIEVTLQNGETYKAKFIKQ